MTQARLPLWFRAVVASLFAALFVLYLLLRGDGAREALAKPSIEPFVRRAADAKLDAEAAAAWRMGEPENGAYLLNGMLVRYHTYPVPVGGAEALGRFEQAMRKTGYVTRTLTLQGQPTLVGIHPKTYVMVSVRPGRDRAGRTTVRLSQQDLSTLDPKFAAEIPGVPVYPGAGRRVLVKSVEGRKSTSLMYHTTTSPDAAARFYLEEMRRRGWERLVPPVQAPIGQLATLFFHKAGQETSVVILPNAEAGGSLVMVTTNEARERGT